MAFTLRQLQFFIAAAEQGSVTGAARVLSISQSSVTEAIRALEDDLGVTLFERQARGLEITHLGSQFLRHAQQILADVSNAGGWRWASPRLWRAMCCPTSCRAFAARIPGSS